MEPKVAHRVARKLYRCDGAECSRSIERGDPYTQTSVFRLEPNQPGRWEIGRYCTACRHIPPELLPAPIPCPYGDSENRCILTDGHHPATDHQYAIGLF